MEQKLLLNKLKMMANKDNESFLMFLSLFDFDGQINTNDVVVLSNAGLPLQNWQEKFILMPSREYYMCSIIKENKEFIRKDFRFNVEKNCFKLTNLVRVGHYNVLYITKNADDFTLRCSLPTESPRKIYARNQQVISDMFDPETNRMCFFE